jgi:hypothetical protein
MMLVVIPQVDDSSTMKQAVNKAERIFQMVECTGNTSSTFVTLMTRSLTLNYACLIFQLRFLRIEVSKISCTDPRE